MKLSALGRPGASPNFRLVVLGRLPFACCRGEAGGWFSTLLAFETTLDDLSLLDASMPVLVLLLDRDPDGLGVLRLEGGETGLRLGEAGGEASLVGDDDLDVD